MPSDGVFAKAERLLTEGRLEPYTAAEAFRVDGDSGTYTVVVGPDVAFCSCPATVKCSHVAAAERWYRAERDSDFAPSARMEFAEYVQWLAERRNHEEVGA